MARIGHFADELTKVAFGLLKVPSISTGGVQSLPKSGAGVAAAAITPPTPAVKSAVKSFGGSAKVPTAAGSNMGTKITPRPKTTPVATRGGSLVR